MSYCICDQHLYSQALSGVPWCNLTKYLSDLYLFIFPSYSTVSMEVISSILMWMHKLIWVCSSCKGLIVPNEFSQSLHSVSPNFRFIPLFSSNIYQSCNDYATGRRHTILRRSHFQYRLQKYKWRYPEDATVTFPCPAWRKRMLVTVTSQQIVVDTA